MKSSHYKWWQFLKIVLFLFCASYKIGTLCAVCTYFHFTESQNLDPEQQGGFNTKSPTIVFLLGSTKPLPSYGKTSRTGDTVLVKSREMTGRTQTLQWWLKGEGVKTTENKIDFPRCRAGRIYASPKANKLHQSFLISPEIWGGEFIWKTSITTRRKEEKMHLAY